MDNKPKARSPAKRTTKAKEKDPEKTQRERFIEAARKVGVDETGGEFENAMRVIAHKKSETTN